ncbi:MAG: hypothetical protein ACXWCS_12095, partial [Burkholderiales bacterium]
VSVPAIFAVAASVISAADPLRAGPLIVERADDFAAVVADLDRSDCELRGAGREGALEAFLRAAMSFCIDEMSRVVQPLCLRAS